EKKGEAELAEADSIFSLYLSAYDGKSSHAHTHAREETLVPEQKATPGNIAEPAPRQEQAGTDLSLDPDGYPVLAPDAALGTKESGGTHPDDDWPEMPAFLVRTEQGRG